MTTTRRSCCPHRAMRPRVWKVSARYLQHGVRVPSIFFLLARILHEVPVHMGTLICSLAPGVPALLS